MLALDPGGVHGPSALLGTPRSSVPDLPWGLPQFPRCCLSPPLCFLLPWPPTSSLFPVALESLLGALGAPTPPCGPQTCLCCLPTHTYTCTPLLTLAGSSDRGQGQTSGSDSPAQIWSPPLQLIGRGVSALTPGFAQSPNEDAEKCSLPRLRLLIHPLPARPSPCTPLACPSSFHFPRGDLWRAAAVVGTPTRSPPFC